MTREFLDLDKVIDDPEIKIIICCGSGGVGKTTTSAAIAVRAAEAGRKVVVLTIDPARRLAQSLGLGELDNTPRPVAKIDTAAGGRLDAMMLDMKRTFDDVVVAHSTPEKAAQILANPFYEALSSSFSGTQEYMAMEKLGQLHAAAESEGHWDLIVVDTPPARSALDFLEAPEHLSSLLDGRFLRLLLAPARGPLRLMSVGFNLVSAAMTKVLGAQVIRDVQTFVTAFEALFGGFRQRAASTFALLSSAAHHVCGGGHAATRRASGGGLLCGPADRGADAALRPGAQPGTHHGAGHLARARALPGRGPGARGVPARGRGAPPAREPDAPDRRGSPSNGSVQRVPAGGGRRPGFSRYRPTSPISPRCAGLATSWRTRTDRPAWRPGPSAPSSMR